MILYKYCDERGIDLLKNARIKISDPSNINDPFEFLPQAEDGIDDLEPILDDLYEYQTKNYRILSLTKCQCNIVMWGHYCNKHKGILYKIDTKHLPDVESSLVEVNYAKDRPRIDFKALLKAFKDKDTRELEKNLRLITYTKFEDWQYEQEVRAIVSYDHETNYDYINMPANTILEVVLGMYAMWETQTLVEVLLREPRFDHVKLKKAEMDREKYSMVYKDVLR